LGGVPGCSRYFLYKSVLLGVILTGANGAQFSPWRIGWLWLIPLSMQRMGRDPAIGSSVMLTAITDSGASSFFLGSLPYF